MSVRRYPAGNTGETANEDLLSLVSHVNSSEVSAKWFGGSSVSKETHYLDFMDKSPKTSGNALPEVFNFWRLF
jgi:hypothetical protein